MSPVIFVFVVVFVVSFSDKKSGDALGDLDVYQGSPVEAGQVTPGIILAFS